MKGQKIIRIIKLLLPRLSIQIIQISRYLILHTYYNLSLFIFVVKFHLIQDVFYVEFLQMVLLFRICIEKNWTMIFHRTYHSRNVNIMLWPNNMRKKISSDFFFQFELLYWIRKWWMSSIQRKDVAGNNAAWIVKFCSHMVILRNLILRVLFYSILYLLLLKV